MTVLAAASMLAAPAVACAQGPAQGPEQGPARGAVQATAHGASAGCPDAGLSLPPGFCATVFADHLGHVRHLAVAPDGVVYANTWSGRYYHNAPPPPGGFLIALRDSTGQGRADQVQRFGPTAAEGDAGGTGIAVYHDHVYAEMNDRIVRYALPPPNAPAGAIAPPGPAETVVSGLPLSGDHPMHPFAIDTDGALYVDLGSATNSCQPENRMPEVPGNRPCTELRTRGGIWRYDANALNQAFGPARRFVTGLRNGEGISFDSAGRIFATQHGRDQLSQNWPRLYSTEDGENEPAEELVLLRPGADFGWPECYFDLRQDRLVLAPEYGGDGGKAVGVCARKQGPVAAFPAHWAPNDMLIYRGAMFPAAYQDGAFIAFHGSWNRAPGPQGGYNVVFQPLQGGVAAGRFVVFADGFAGPVKQPGAALHRPTGLAVGPHGALYIADDQGGRIWRVTFHGDRGAPLAAAPAAPAGGQGGSIGTAIPPAVPPEGLHPHAGQAALPVPPGASPDQVARGDAIFHGRADGGTCAGCHGADAKGSALGPNLTDGHWLWGDGSLAAIERTIQAGVPHPRKHLGAMPPEGGLHLSQADLAAVADYVWAISHPAGARR